MALSETRFQVTEPDHDAALDLLRRDRAWSAYALGYLDRDSQAEVQMLAAEVAGSPVSLLVTSRVNELNTVFGIGDLLIELGPTAIGFARKAFFPQDSCA